MNENHSLLRESLIKMAVVAEHTLEIAEMHVQRVRGYVHVIARGLDLPEAEATLMADACILHDIGMVSIPTSVVRKATNLTNEEWEFVRGHPTVGAELLAGSDQELFKLARTVSLTHHERWDGSGYPAGLKEEEIPLAGRICGLCDVFDTLTHPRAYKRALSPDEVLMLLEESSEMFFDPRIVDVFKLKYNDILDVRNQFPSK